MSNTASPPRTTKMPKLPPPTERSDTLRRAALPAPPPLDIPDVIRASLTAPESLPQPLPELPTTPSGWSAPEATQAGTEALERDKEAVAVFTSEVADDLKKMNKKDRRKLGGLLSRLDVGDWENVVLEMQTTGNVHVIASSLSMSTDEVEALMNFGIPRLELPPIKKFIDTRAKANMAMRDRREQAALDRDARSPEVAEAITERVVQEAAGAQQMLSATMQASSILGSALAELTKRLGAGSSTFDIPEFVTVEVIKDLMGAVSTNARAMDSAVKLVRLVAGQPTERIEHRIAALVASCTTEELLEAEMHGTIPGRLAPPKKKPKPKMIDVGLVSVTGIDDDLRSLAPDAPEPTERPSWLEEIESIPVAKSFAYSDEEKARADAGDDLAIGTDPKTAQAPAPTNQKDEKRDG